MNTPTLSPDDLPLIEQSASRKQLFDALGIDLKQENNRTKNPDDWWALSPLTDEKTPSFHMNEKGWYCHSSKQGGGVIKLVQAVIQAQTGETLEAYDAARWLLDNHVSYLPHLSKTPYEKEKKVSEKPKAVVKPKIEVNKSIRQNLIPLFDIEHPYLEQRGISPKTCEYLGCGYFRGDKSKLKNRLIFQIRGVENNKSMVLSHTGRAIDDETQPKWLFPAGFKKHLELYNQDKLQLDDKAIEQAQKLGHIILVEGTIDVARLVDAGVLNTVACFGSYFSPEQSMHLKSILSDLKINSCLLMLDRDKSGQDGQQRARMQLLDDDIGVKTFNWEISFRKRQGKPITIPENINDPADFSTEQIQWLRKQEII